MRGQRESAGPCKPTLSKQPWPWLVFAVNGSSHPRRNQGSPCAACAHASEHGWWGDTLPAGYTHDRDSHRSFPGSQRWGSCARCGELFSGVTAWDMHQRHDDDGEYTEDCLCSFALREKPNGGRLPQTWVVSAKQSLYRLPSYFDDGYHWAGEPPDFGGAP